MGVFGFVIAMLASAAGLMGARWLFPHVINNVGLYAAMALATIGFCGAVVGVVRG